MPSTWEEAAREAANALLLLDPDEHPVELENVLNEDNEGLLTELQDDIYVLKHQYFGGEQDHGPVDDSNLYPLYMANEAFAWLCDINPAQDPGNLFESILDLVCERHAKYGPGNILSFKYQGIVVRLSDKVERLTQLARTQQESSDESLVDTLTDIVGYCIIWKMLDQDNFELPLNADISENAMVLSDLEVEYGDEVWKSFSMKDVSEIWIAGVCYVPKAD